MVSFVISTCWLGPTLNTCHRIPANTGAFIDFPADPVGAANIVEQHTEPIPQWVICAGQDLRLGHQVGIDPGHPYALEKPAAGGYTHFIAKRV